MDTINTKQSSNSSNSSKKSYSNKNRLLISEIEKTKKYLSEEVLSEVDFVINDITTHTLQKGEIYLDVISNSNVCLSCKFTNLHTKTPYIIINDDVMCCPFFSIKMILQLIKRIMNALHITRFVVTDASHFKFKNTQTNDEIQIDTTNIFKFVYGKRFYDKYLEDAYSYEGNSIEPLIEYINTTTKLNAKEKEILNCINTGSFSSTVEYFSRIKTIMANMGEKNVDGQCIFNVDEARWEELLTYQKVFEPNGLFEKYGIRS